MIKTKRRTIELKVDFPRIVCLCGSTRFMEAFREANLRETLAGNIILTVGCDFKSEEVLGREMSEFTPEVKIRLDELHKRKIDLSDEILVLNVDGYIGESTRSEIEYAERTGKTIRYLELDLIECATAQWGATCFDVIEDARNDLASPNNNRYDPAARAAILRGEKMCAFCKRQNS